jgi:hypothetical protein
MLAKSKFLTVALAAITIATTGSLLATGEASAKGFKGGMMHAHHMHHHHGRHFARWYVGGGGSCWVYTRAGLVNICEDDDD